jgi:agmatine deiminase
MPAEWEPHEATWLAWPHNREDWPGKFAPIAWVYCEVVRKLARAERVRILVQDEDLEHDARRKLKKAGADLDAVEFLRCPTNRRLVIIARCLSRVQARSITNWRFSLGIRRSWTIRLRLSKRLKMRQCGKSTWCLRAASTSMG